jgi:hypothetical protein
MLQLTTWWHMKARKQKTVITGARTSRNRYNWYHDFMCCTWKWTWQSCVGYSQYLFAFSWHMICMLNALLSCHVLSEGTTCWYMIQCKWTLCVVHGNGLGNHLLDLLCNSVAWPVATQTERGQHGGHCLCDKLRKMGTCHVLFCPHFMSLHTDAAHGTCTWNQHMEPAHGRTCT